MTVYPNQYNKDVLTGSESIGVYDSTGGMKMTTPDDLKTFIAGTASAAEVSVLEGSSTPVTVVSGTQATLSVEPGVDANDAVTYTAVDYGAAGNSITVTHVDPGANDDVLAITVVGTDITVSLATGAAGAVTTTSGDIETAIAASGAATLVTAVAQGTGAGLAAAATEAPLTGGVDVTAGVLGAIRFKSDGSTAYMKVAEQTWKKWTLSAL